MHTPWRLFTLIFAFAGLMLSGPVMAVEEPKYQVVSKDEAFELRDYPGMIAAEVTVSGERDAAMNAGFRLIADYIFGNNRQSAKVAMTAPVTQSAASEKIAMTAPVTQSGSGTSWTVRFIMPARYTMATLPQPNNDRVTLVELPAQRFAVLRFSGTVGAKDIAARTQELMTWAKGKGLVMQGEVTLARYDPPWTPWFLRRNELMVPVVKG